MRLKSFNKDKSLKKLHLNRNKNTYIKRTSIILSVLILVIAIIYFTFAKYEGDSNEYTLINATVGDFSKKCNYKAGYIWNFDYNGTNGSDGSIQEFTVPCDGIYKLEVWGAQGGTAYDGTQGPGGYGGYSVGTTNLEDNQSVFIGVGGAGQGTQNMCDDATGGYNGGGNAYHWFNGTKCDTYTGSGGGATHIATKTGVLSSLESSKSSVLIVAGGGGGSAYYSGTSTTDKSGGAAGGIVGNPGSFPQRYLGLGGTQNSGGGYSANNNYSCSGCTPGTGGFGKGGNSSPTGKTGNITSMSGGAGGGAGWYGGGGSSIESTAGGGSGYIGNNLLSNKHMYCYNCTTSPSSESSTYTISNGTSSCHNSVANADCAKEGNGYAKITLVSTTQTVEVPEVELYDGMVPVYFKDGNTYVADVSDANWYNYADHKWANAVLVSNPSTYLDSNGNVLTAKKNTQITSGILQYYVWIPRYRYKLFNAGNGTSANEQVIDIKFENIDAAYYTKANGNANGKWLTHPAFTFGSTELKGIWVGKFETSSTDGIQTTENQLATKTSNIRILPNVISASNNNIYNIYTVSRAIESDATFGLTSNQVDTHMMKNMEWGAVAYLSQSKYGIFKNDESCTNPNQKDTDDNNKCKIFINNITISNGPTVTGCSSSGANSNTSHSTNTVNPTCASTYEWNQNGVLASTTGNMYGVYDMSGGTWEYVMGNQSSSTNTYSYYAASSSLATQPNDRYFDKYLAAAENTTVMSSDDQSKVQNRGLLGDATRETLKTYGNLYGGWNGDYTAFVNSVVPWFSRGGTSTSSSGIFAFGRASGASNLALSFHVVLTKQDGNN